MIWAFNQVAKGHLPTAVVLREMNKEKEETYKNSFMEALRNVAYIGKLYLKAYNDEEEVLWKGSMNL
jgi:hypothetical protein